MTVEEAIKNAEAYEIEMEEAKTLLEIARANGDQSQERRQRSRLSHATAMVKWYRGDIRYPLKEVNGKMVQNIDATPLWSDMGKIRQLLNEASKLREASNLGAKFLQRTFGNFDKRLNPQAFEICQIYADREDLFAIDGNERNSLIISGNVGTGKTHLAAAIANKLVSKGIPVLFATFGEHLEHIKEEYDHTDKKEYLSRMKNIPMLVIDDIGKEKPTEWSQQVLFDVMNFRYEHKYPMVITTNLGERDLREHIGDALYSRACEMCSLVITKGGDQRRNQ